MYFLLLILCKLALVLAQDSWVVTTEYGDVRGFWTEEHNVWSFRGMPYAAPPLGRLRFKAPVKPAPWSGVLNATESTKICTQSTQSSSTEDCLIINVFVPESARTAGPLPVLFFTHGGGFTVGNSNRYNPFMTTRHDVILITVNYRLGAFGYLCLGTDRAPGNAAIQDLVEALRWTNKNIASFGGDPDAVTIYGESAGAVSVESLLLVEEANGLFHRAIMESGSVLSDWAYNYNRLAQAKATAFNLGFSHVDDLDRLGEFFENAPAEDILQAGHALCIEREIDGIEAAIVQSARQAFDTGNYNQVPVMFAYTDLEGVSFVQNFFDVIDDLNYHFADFLPTGLVFPSESERIEVAERVKRVYFGDALVTADSPRGYIDFMTDTMFFSPLFRSVLYHSSNSDNPVYLMEFSHRGGFNQPNTLFPEIIGAGHADIVAYVMDLGHYNNETLAEDQIVRDRMTEIWANFVKYGDPTPEISSLPVRWQPFTRTEQSYLSMSSAMVLRQFPLRVRAELWAELYDTYYYPPPRFPNSGSAVKTFLFLFSCVMFVFNLF